ncbi:MAG TPA: FHA domain-containing protein [Anaerolineales bacterium]|nr:FHA domain-containing protein [Anaerolineales bacterium]HRQ93165.1 FHA domain-containing protein [Anaerolineales bacterium]
MSRITRLYYYTLLGAIGGLIGWQVSNVLGLSFAQNVYLSEVVVGGLIGFCIGALIGASEGVALRSAGYALRAGLQNGLFGLVGGAIGLPLAEGAFQLLGGDAWTRAVGWAVFGGFIGAGLGFSSGSQMWKPALGGLLGGAVGGALLELARVRLADALIGKAIGLGLLGAAIGALIALIVLLLSRAWLEVVSGKLKGTEFVLDKFVHANGPTAYVGSSALKADIVLPDPDIDPQHAILTGGDTHMNIRDMSQKGTFINGRKVQQARLLDEQAIRLGNTQLVYHEKR